ncbi:MAG: hypothetical protein K2W82_14310 [Candidatus Obscuribacterales bacterium]|nr:hypothetical protein [Candidatus Obscuribacterales bacterium]
MNTILFSCFFVGLALMCYGAIYGDSDTWSFITVEIGLWLCVPATFVIFIPALWRAFQIPILCLAGLLGAFIIYKMVRRSRATV